MKDMIFDQFSRYQACADLIGKAGIKIGDSVLDVGSGPECLFGGFLPNADVTFVDPLIAESGNKHIVGGIHVTGLDKRAFDFVTAVDVFEHVPPEARNAFVDRMTKLAKKVVVLGFPNLELPDAGNTDQFIDTRYQSVYSKNYPWLQEHYTYGLPSLDDTVAKLRAEGWHCQIIGHGHTPWLRELLSFVVCAWDTGGMSDVVLDVSRKFNEELYPLDFRGPCYRSFIVASREELPEITFENSSLDHAKADERFAELMTEAYFASIRIAGRGVQTITELENNALALQTNNLNLQKSIVDLQNENADLRKSKTELEVLQAEQAVLLDRQHLKINNLEESLDLLTKENSLLASNYEVLSSGMQLLRSTKAFKLNRLLIAMRTLILDRQVSIEDKISLKSKLQSVHRALPFKVQRGTRELYRYIRPEHTRILTPSPLSEFNPPNCPLRARVTDKADFVIWGVIDWHFRHQRPQHIANALTKAGHRVFYITPNLVDASLPGFSAEPLSDQERAGKYKLFQIAFYAEDAPAIYHVAPSAPLNAQLRKGVGELLLWANSGQVISLVQHPFWYDVANVIPASRMVYDCMDHHEGFGNNCHSILNLERQLISDAMLTVTTSAWLEESVRREAKCTALIRNAGEYEHFSNPPRSVYKDDKGRRVIGYFGAIAEWFDQDLLEDIARRFSNEKILLIGDDSIGAKARLGKFKNVEFIGEIPYQELPFYVHGFDVCLLPFKVMDLTLATNPVKIYEYLGAGKPVVTVDLPEMKQFDDLVRVANGNEQYLDFIAESLEDSSTKAVNARKQFASEQTWRHRASDLVQAIKAASDQPKISIIVVTYNNLDLTKKCLRSIDQNSNYENLEIIVVDNASADGSPAFLQQWESGSLNRFLILNDDNRGFSAANNQGLEQATGDYLVLLNNDTYVTTEWVAALVAHLRRDPSIGLIGPVTNNIGNEAKIDISYNTMDEMQSASIAYTSRHIGETLELRTLAFFCVMMNRSVYDKIGGLDEQFGIGFFEDDDYCRRVEMIGLRMVCADDVFIHHHLSASFDKLKQSVRQKLFETNKALYEKKWGEWLPHGYRSNEETGQIATVGYTAKKSVLSSYFDGQLYKEGECNICGEQTRFFYTRASLWRESLNCKNCISTSRYRSIAAGILRAIEDITGISSRSLAELPKHNAEVFRVYDSQPPFYFESCAYPLPDKLKATQWAQVMLSMFRPNMKLGATIREGVFNQNLEALTFDDESLDLVVTSDVMEHVRLDDRAHREIHRVLKMGGAYVFTVPHNRETEETLVRVKVHDPLDSAKDEHLLEPEYHGDTNAADGGGVLSYRVYGLDLDKFLTEIGFEVEYSNADQQILGILNTELYYCRKVR